MTHKSPRYIKTHCPTLLISPKDETVQMFGGISGFLSCLKSNITPKFLKHRAETVIHLVFERGSCDMTASVRGNFTHSLQKHDNSCFIGRLLPIEVQTINLKRLFSDRSNHLIVLRTSHFKSGNPET